MERSKFDKKKLCARIEAKKTSPKRVLMDKFEPVCARLIELPFFRTGIAPLGEIVGARQLEGIPGTQILTRVLLAALSPKIQAAIPVDTWSPELTPTRLVSVTHPLGSTEK